MPENTHQDNPQPKPKPKKRQPVKKNDPRAERMAATFVILGCLAAGASGILMYYHLDTPLVWASFLMILFFLVAIHFHWRSHNVKMLCVIAGIFLFFGCLTWQRRLSVSKFELSPTPTPKALSEPSPSSPLGEISQTRVFLDIDPEKLLAFFDRYNKAQVDDLVKPYIGKWVDMSGTVVEVSRDLFWGKDARPIPGITVSIATARRDKKDKSDIVTQAEFDEKRWTDRAFVLKSDEEIKVRGQIKNVFAHGFVLEHCEIIE